MGVAIMRTAERRLDVGTFTTGLPKTIVATATGQARLDRRSAITSRTPNPASPRPCPLLLGRRAPRACREPTARTAQRPMPLGHRWRAGLGRRAPPIQPGSGHPRRRRAWPHAVGRSRTDRQGSRGRQLDGSRDPMAIAPSRGRSRSRTSAPRMNPCRLPAPASQANAGTGPVGEGGRHASAPDGPRDCDEHVALSPAS